MYRRQRRTPPAEMKDNGSPILLQETCRCGMIPLSGNCKQTELNEVYPNSQSTSSNWLPLLFEEYLPQALPDRLAYGLRSTHIQN